MVQSQNLQIRGRFKPASGVLEHSDSTLSLVEGSLSDKIKTKMLSLGFQEMSKKDQQNLASELMVALDAEGKTFDTFCVTTPERIVVVSSKGKGNSQINFSAFIGKNEIELSEDFQEGFNPIDLRKGLPDFAYNGFLRKCQAGHIGLILEGVFNSVEDQVSEKISDSLYNTVTSFGAIGSKPRMLRRFPSPELDLVAI